MDFFTSHGDYIDVMETVAGKLAGIISGTAGVPSIAFATAFKRAGVISNSRRNTVSVFELDTLRVI